MIKTLKISIMVFLILLTINLSSALPQTDNFIKNLLGEWDVETEGRQYHFFFKFYLDEDQLKGLYEGTTGIYTMENLSIEEDTVYFSVEINASPHNLVLDFEATIDEESLYGFLSLEHGIAAIMGSKK